MVACKGALNIAGPSSLFDRFAVQDVAQIGDVPGEGTASVAGHVHGTLASRRHAAHHGAMSRAARLPLPEEVIRPTFRRERAAMKRGLMPVAGCDEAGRGPLAG